MRTKSWFRRNVWLFLLLLCVGALLYFADAANTSALGITRPVSIFFSNIGFLVRDIGDTLWNGSWRAEEIRRLRIENRAFEAERATNDYIRKENEELRNALGREQEHIEFIYAYVVGRSSSRVDDAFIIDAGVAEGVAVGMPVLVVEASIQVGTIEKVAAHSSVVQLLSHVGEKMSVSLPKAGVLSVATGQGGGILEIQIPARIPVEEGEPLFSVGPPDFLLGYVEHIEKSNAGPFQIARTSHPITLSDVRRVFVVTSTQ